MSVTLICRNCNKEFIRPYKRRYRKYCSIECYHKSKKGRKLNLSEEEIVSRRQRAYQVGLNKYWVGRKHTQETIEKLKESKKNNPLKGKKITGEHKRKISEASRRHWQDPEYRNKLLQERKNRNQTKENNPNWKNGASEKVNYGPGWKRQKRLALERDGCVCQICGIQRGLFYPKELDVHHLIPFRINRNNSLKNLITVCRYCHGKLGSAFVNIYEKNGFDYRDNSHSEIKYQLTQFVSAN